MVVAGLINNWFKNIKQKSTYHFNNRLPPYQIIVSKNETRGLLIPIHFNCTIKMKNITDKIYKYHLIDNVFKGNL